MGFDWLAVGFYFGVIGLYRLSLQTNPSAMNKFISIVLSISAICSCGQQICTIRGEISDPVDSVRLFSMKGSLVDQCAVTDGAFTLTCEIDSENGVSVSRGENYDPISLIPDTKEIIITMDEGKPVVSGSPLSNELQELQQWALSTFMENSMKAMSLIEAGDQKGADAINAEMHKTIASHCREIYLNHKTDALGMQAMTLMMMDLDEDEFMELYEQGGKVIQEDAQIGGYYEHLKSMPQKHSIILSEDGKVLKERSSFEDYVGVGKYTLVDFWASWCGPCKEETPNVIAIYEKYRSEGLMVIGVPVNDKLDATEKALKELGIHYPQVLDPSQELAEKFGITGIPRIILFDPEGNIVADGLRGSEIEASVRRVIFDQER